MIRRTLLSLLALFALAGTAFSQGEIKPDQITADDSDFSYESGELTLKGNAKLGARGVFLQADEIRYHQKSGRATARGRVELTRGPQRLLADEIVYNLQTDTYTVTRMRLGEYPLYLSGDGVSGTRKEITVNNATLTYHEPTLFGPTLRAGKLVYVPQESIRAEAVRIGIGKYNLFRFPTLEQNLSDPLLSYLDATAGYRGNLGAFGGIGAHAPIFPGVKLGGDISFYTKRGFLAGPSGAYDVKNADHVLGGTLQTGFIHDNGEKLTDILGQPVPEDRAFIDWQHRHRLSENLLVFGQVHYWSDSEVVRDFRAEEFYPVQQPDTFLEGVYTGDNYIVSLFARAQPNSYYRVQQRLPELRFDLLPTRIGPGLYERFEASAAVLREDAVLAGPTLRSDRYDAYYALSLPYAPREWLNLTPVAGGRVTHYARATGGRSDYTRVLGEVGVDASLRASGVFAYKNEQWGIDGIRHLTTPRLSYRYIPKADRGRAYIPPTDDDVFMTYLEPLGLGDRRNIDRLRATNTVRLGWDNLFQTREKTYGSRDLLQLNFAADLDLDPAPGERELSAIHTELAFTPVNWLEFNLYQSVTPQDFTLRELNTGLTLRDGEVWSLHFANHYLRRQIQEYSIEGRYRLNEAYNTYARFHYDARKSRFVEQSFGVIQSLHNLWTIRYGVSIYNGPRRESDFGFNVEIRLAGF